MQEGRSDIAAHGLANKALAHARLGEFAQAEKELAHALELAEQTDVPVKRADVHLVASLASFDMGQVQNGLDFARRGVDESLGSGAGECAIYGMYCLGQGNLQIPNLGEAKTSFGQGLQRTEHLRSEMLAYLNRAGLALAESKADSEDALEQAERALAQARAFRDVYTEAQISQSLAELHLRLGDLQRAEEYVNVALAYYRSNDMLPYLVRSVGLAAYLYEKQGRTEDAAAANSELAQLQERYDKALLERDEVLATV
jgi:tetratricopeptide (TPR) repeat protein